jgi:homoserine kinase type II
MLLFPGFTLKVFRSRLRSPQVTVGCAWSGKAFSLGLYPFVKGELLDVAYAGQVEAAGRTLAKLHEALAAYPRPFGGGRARPSQQLVHGDFRAANILHDGARITAVLDFDEVAHRTRVADLAQAAVLLSTRYHDWGPTSPATRDTFVAAYNDLVPLTSTERDELHRGVSTVLNHFGWT